VASAAGAIGPAEAGAEGTGAATLAVEEVASVSFFLQAKSAPTIKTAVSAVVHWSSFRNITSSSRLGAARSAAQLYHEQGRFGFV
jgi:hypothetical protein